MRCGKTVQNPHRWPKLCDFVSAKFSRVWIVLQYFSMLLRGRGRRLALLYGADGCASMQDWLATARGKVLAKRLLHGVLVASSWIHARHACTFQEWPWRLASICDLRLPYAERLAIAVEFFKSHSCDLDCYMGRRLQLKLQCEEDLLTDEWLEKDKRKKQDKRCSFFPNSDSEHRVLQVVLLIGYSEAAKGLDASLALGCGGGTKA